MKKTSSPILLILMLILVFICFAESSLAQENTNNIKIINGISVPSYFPLFKPNVNKAASSKDKIFLINSRTDNNFLMIFENDGTPYFYKEISGISGDFKLHENGTFTYWLGNNVKGFVVLDSSLTVIDTFKCSNGIDTDFHEITILKDGSYILFGEAPRKVDMSELIEGGNPNATLLDNIIQKFNSDNELIFEWHSGKYFDVLDANGINLNSSNLDYVHINSIAVDFDSNLIISSRHLCEVTKIDKNSGKIIWRFGGENNQFNIINDEYNFSYQHDVRPVKGKPNHYLMFDNGNLRDEKFSRAVEYKIDTLTMSAEKIWEYRAEPDYFTKFMGSTQRLDNGNTIINWSSVNAPKLTEVTEGGEIVYEGNFIDDYHVYRTHRYNYNGKIDEPYLLIEPFEDKTTLLYNKFGDSTISYYKIYWRTENDEFELIDSTYNTFYDINEVEVSGKYLFAVSGVDSKGVEGKRSNIVEVNLNSFSNYENLIKNGEFTENLSSWNLFNDTSVTLNHSFLENGIQLDIESENIKLLDVLLSQNNITLINNVEYILEFNAYAEKNSVIKIRLGTEKTDYAKIGNVAILNELKHFEYKFMVSEKSNINSSLLFQLGIGNNSLIFKNISLKRVEVTSVEQNTFPEDYILKQNYPNPFNPKTTIEYSIGKMTNKNQFVQLKLYDLLGQEVKSLAEGYHKTGNYKVELDGSNLASGVYIYKFEAGNYSASKKLVLLK